MSAPTALRLDAVAVDFGRGPGLLPISLDVAAGERLVVLGASGAGKTTLLRAVAGLAPLRAGRVWIAAPGGPLRDVTALAPERRNAVYLHQTPTPFAHMSVYENVAFALRVRRVGAAELERRVRDALVLVQMEPFATRMPNTLSGGQRHRVALARAIAARPAVLLLDEPLAALDPSLRDDVREAIVRAQEGPPDAASADAASDGARPALVLVTHDLDEAGLLAHRIAVLAERRILQIAPPAELFTRPASLAVARVLGVGAEVAGMADRGRFVSALGDWTSANDPTANDPTVNGPTVAGPAVSGPAVAVVRPDALRVADASDGADVGVAGEVLAVRHRARQTTIQIRFVRDGFAPAIVEGIAPDGALPAPGGVVRVVADARMIPVFPAAPR